MVSDLKTLARDYLKLEDSAFVLKHEITKEDLEDKLDNDEKFSEEFEDHLDQAFTEKTKRDLYVTISSVMDELRGGDKAPDERRIAQQLLQSMVSMKKILLEGKKKTSDVSDLLNEVGL